MISAIRLGPWARFQTPIPRTPRGDDLLSTQGPMGSEDVAPLLYRAVERESR